MATRKKVKSSASEIQNETTENMNETGVTSNPAEADIIDVDLSAIRKKRFRIDGDNNRILYLDTSDFSILKRIEEMAPKMYELVAQAFAERAKEEEDNIEADNKLLEDVDQKMRALLDQTFDTNVSEVCSPSGYMFDLFNGELRFEHILRVIIKLYEANIEKEYRALNKKISAYTSKYINKK